MDMRYTYKLLFSLLLAAGLGLGVMGCDSLTEGYDEDPTSATTAETGLILNSAEVASILFHDGNHARIAAMWSSQLTGSDRQYSGINSYNANAGDFSNIWITGYADVIGDVSVVKEETRGSNPLMHGIAKVIEAHTFGTKTALHGDIPFSDASQGEGELNPTFDSQTDVYSDVIDSLDAAIADLQAGGISPGSRDVFFGGEAEPWIETAYTLKARFLLHTGDYQGALEAAQNGISDPDNNMVAPHGGTRSVDTNPFWLFHQEERPGYLTANDSYAAALLDERTSEYRGNSKTDESARFEHYFTGDVGAWDLNTEEGAYFGMESDYPLVTYVENELIKAEAELHVNGATGDALAALNNAREANDVKFPSEELYEDYALSDFQSGGIANPQGESQANALLREVLEEKYLSLMAHIEAFNDIRRTDNFLDIEPKAGNELPQRFLIGQGEADANENAPDPIPGIFDPTPVNQNIDYTGVQ